MPAARGTAPDGTTLVTSSQPIFDGLSSITAFRNATRISIVDETPTDTTFGQVIGGFDSSKAASTNVAANWTDAFGNFSIQVNAGAFTSNGLKTVKIFATDDAGSSGNPVTVQFTLAVTGISAPTPPITPTLELAPTMLPVPLDTPTSPRLISSGLQRPVQLLSYLKPMELLLAHR